MITIKTLRKDYEFILSEYDEKIIINLCERLRELNLKEINEEE